MRLLSRRQKRPGKLQVRVVFIAATFELVWRWVQKTRAKRIASGHTPRLWIEDSYQPARIVRRLWKHARGLPNDQ